jgi:hypothetical protein
MTSLLPDEKKTLNKGMESSEIPTQTSMTFDMTRNITATILRSNSKPAGIVGALNCPKRIVGK